MEKNYLFALGGFVLAILLISVFSGITGHSIFNWIFSSEDSSQGNSLSSSEMHSNQDSASSEEIDHCWCYDFFKEIIWREKDYNSSDYPRIYLEKDGEICHYADKIYVACYRAPEGHWTCYEGRGAGRVVNSEAEKACEDAYQRWNNMKACLRGEKFQDNKICKEMKKKWNSFWKKAEEECIPCESEKRCEGGCEKKGEDCHLVDGEWKPVSKDKIEKLISLNRRNKKSSYTAQVFCYGGCQAIFEPTPEEEPSPAEESTPETIF